MDRWLLIISTGLAVMAGVLGLFSLPKNGKSVMSFPLMLGVMVAQIGYLLIRGEMRGACPLRGGAEIAVYLSWSLTLFYLVVGPVYRLSLLGFFTLPLVILFQVYALLPGQLDRTPERILDTDPWGETHAATAVLAYGAYALASIAGVMFLILDRLLKSQHLKGNLFKNLPPIRELLVCVERLLCLGLILLSIGIFAGFMMPHDQEYFSHLLAAISIWASYSILLWIKRSRGLTGRKLAVATVFLFVISLGVFAVI